MSEQAEAARNVIVVGVDLGETGVHALHEGMRLARQLPGSVLHAVYVLNAPSDLHDAKKIDALCEQASEMRTVVAEHIEHQCRLVGTAYEQEVVIHIRLGEPAPAISQVAVDEDADLLVVGTHARTGVKRLVMGSVAEALLRDARCPVVIAHPKDYSGLDKTPRVDPPRPGQDLRSSGYTESISMRFPERSSHISGLV